MASKYETVFGIILGSGCGGSLVINKKIIQGGNGLGGEWSLNHTPLFNVPNLEPGQIDNFNNSKLKVTYQENLLKKDIMKNLIKI